MDDWENNPNWKELPNPEVGDIVHLKLADAFEYLVKAVVVAVSDEEISAEIEALFDWHTKEQLTGGDKVNLVGKQASFKHDFIQNVIKEPRPNQRDEF